MNTETASSVVTAADDYAIRKVVSRAQESQSDTASLMDLHTPDVVIVNVAGRRVLGRDAFAEAMAAALASSLGNVHTTLDVSDIRLASPDVAVVSCTKTIRDDRTGIDAGALPATGALTYVMVRSEGAWRIALAQTTPTA